MPAYDNKNFIGDNPSIPGDYISKNQNKLRLIELAKSIRKEQGITRLQHMAAAVTANIQQTDNNEPERDTWGNDVEFLMSCIAMSVGLGNIWRFPYTALENGGGAFLIPYLIVLVVVGRPMYYMEMILGQFSSRGTVKLYDMVPAMKGIGYGQILAVFLLSTYYSSIMAIIASYFIDSFKNPLPWALCRPEWINCIDSGIKSNNDSVFNVVEDAERRISSSELYFIIEVINEIDTIDYGIGIPDWRLTLCLILAWIIIFFIASKGAQSSGKASYFLALFPYLVLGILLLRSCTLPGAGKGILYFLTPQWNEMLNPRVWYAAVTQCFFSLSVCFGTIITYASFNKFSHNVHRDATIVAILDTSTSLVAGITIFGILGHLAKEANIDSISLIARRDTGLAFITYPDAIAKFESLPQLFAVAFFFMLFVLGIGSNIAMTACIVTIVRDRFPALKHWYIALIISCFGIGIGSIYLTPGGQFILNLVDFFGVSLIAFVLAIGQLIAVCWIYGVDRLCKDTEFMIGRNPGIYWRLCWGIIAPILMIIILIYTFASYKPLTYRDKLYPTSAYVSGWVIAMAGIIQIPFWIIVTVLKQKEKKLIDKVNVAFTPKENWGPIETETLIKYKAYRKNIEDCNLFTKPGILHRMWKNIFG